MLTKKQMLEYRKRAMKLLNDANIAVTPAEEESMEVVDFGLGDVDNFGLEIIIYLNTDRCCAKELVLFPGQTCAEHRHPPVEGDLPLQSRRSLSLRARRADGESEGQSAERP
jgi:D-lyxose ketol-isomerase